MALHTGDAVLLQKAYSAADMSVVYPVSRGLAPVMVTLVSLSWAQAPSAWGWLGIVLVALGAWCMSGAWRLRGPGAEGLSGEGGGSRSRRDGVGLGAVAAAAMAAYTLWDAYAAAVLEVAVIPSLAISGAAQLLLLTGVLWPRRRELLPSLRCDARMALPIALLAPLSYGLVVLALQLGSPSMVATSRSLNVAVGSVVAVVFLRERPSRAQAAGVALICAGAVPSAR